MNDCLFCRIIEGQIPSAKVYEDEHVLAFEDIDKKAPVHILVIPKKHVASIAALGEHDYDIVANIMRVIQKLAVEYKLEKGFRIVANTGRDGGQSVDHLHFHLLAGRPMTWPPG